MFIGPWVQRRSIWAIHVNESYAATSKDHSTNGPNSQWVHSQPTLNASSRSDQKASRQYIWDRLWYRVFHSILFHRLLQKVLWDVAIGLPKKVIDVWVLMLDDSPQLKHHSIIPILTFQKSLEPHHSIPGTWYPAPLADVTYSIVFVTYLIVLSLIWY